MLKNTKQHILEKSISMFNRYGYVNVRLQHIADEAGLSVGNLAYHFKTKDDIVETIYRQLEIEQKELLSDLKIVPLFVNIDTHLRNTYKIQQKYRFFYSDTFEIIRAFPNIKKKYREYTRWFIAQIELMIAFNVSRGAFVAEKKEGLYQQLAIHYWTNLELWLYQSRIRGIEESDEPLFLDAMWALLLPHLTEIGFREYEQKNSIENFNWL